MTGVLIASWISAALVWWKHGLDSEFADQRLSTALADCRLWLPDLFLFKILRGKNTHTHTMFYCVLIREEVPFHSRQEAARFGCCGPFKSSYWSAQSCWCCCCCWWRRCKLIGCGCQGWGARGMLLHISPSPPPPSLPASLSLFLSCSISLSHYLALASSHPSE